MAARLYVLTGKATYKDDNIAVRKGNKITSEQYARLSEESKAFFTSEDDISQVAQKIGEVEETYTLIGSSVSADPVPLVLDTDESEIELEDNTTYVYRIEATAIRKDVENTHAVFEVTGGIRRGAGAASVELIGTPRVLILPDEFEDWEITVTANTDTGCLRISFTGENGKVVHVSAKVSLNKSI